MLDTIVMHIHARVYSYVCIHIYINMSTRQRIERHDLVFSLQHYVDTIIMNIHARVYLYTCVYIYIHMYIPHRIEGHNPVFSPLHCIRTQRNVLHIFVYLYMCAYIIYICTYPIESRDIIRYSAPCIVSELNVTYYTYSCIYICVHTLYTYVLTPSNRET